MAPNVIRLVSDIAFLDKLAPNSEGDFMNGKKIWQGATIAIFAMWLLTACDSGTDSAANSGNGADRSGIDSLSNAGGGSAPAENAPVEPAKPVVAETLLRRS
jgi:hypothetical protein